MLATVQERAERFLRSARSSGRPGWLHFCICRVYFDRQSPQPDERFLEVIHWPRPESPPGLNGKLIHVDARVSPRTSSHFPPLTLYRTPERNYHRSHSPLGRRPWALNGTPGVGWRGQALLFGLHLIQESALIMKSINQKEKGEYRGN